jgi:hypothetical protein
VWRSFWQISGKEAGYPLRSGVPDLAGCWFTTLGDLERKLIGLVITVLSVVFLGHIVVWDGQGDLRGFGVAIGAVIAGLTFPPPRAAHAPTARP